LKVTGNNGAVARIGKLDSDILRITDGSGNVLMNVSNDADGESKFCGW
jgi:hypothetical protein